MSDLSPSQGTAKGRHWLTSEPPRAPLSFILKQALLTKSEAEQQAQQAKAMMVLPKCESIVPPRAPLIRKKRGRYKPRAPSNYIQQARDRMNEHPEEVAAIMAASNHPKITARLRKRAQILLILHRNSTVSCSQIAAEVVTNTPHVVRVIKNYVQLGTRIITTDAPRTGRPSKFTPDFMLKLEALLLFTPMQLWQQGLFTRYTQALSGRSFWTGNVVASVLGVTPPSIYSFYRRLNLGSVNEPLELCPNPERDFIGNLLRVDLLRKFGRKLGYEVWLYDSLSYTRDRTLSLTPDGKHAPETTTLMVLVQPHSGKVAATLHKTPSDSDIAALINQLLPAELAHKKPQERDELFSLPEPIIAIGERWRAAEQAQYAAQKQRMADQRAAAIAAGRAKYAVRKAAADEIIAHYADELKAAKERAAAAESAALQFENAIDQRFSTLQQVMTSEAHVLSSRAKERKPQLTPEEQARDQAKHAARRKALKAAQEVKQIEAKIKAHAQAVGELAVSGVMPEVEVEYTDNARIEEITPKMLAQKDEQVTGLAEIKRKIIIVVDARSAQAQLWEQARERFPTIEIVFAPIQATGKSPSQQLFARLEGDLMNHSDFKGIGQLEQGVQDMLAIYNHPDQRRGYPWELDTLLLLNRRIYTKVWGQRNLKALDNVMLDFNEVHYDDEQQNELKPHTWATLRHLRKVATIKTTFEYDGLLLINSEVWQHLAERFAEALEHEEVFAHIDLKEREAIGFSVAHQELLSAPAQAAYESPQQARAMLTLLKQRVPNQPYHPTLPELLPPKERR